MKKFLLTAVMLTVSFPLFAVTTAGADQGNMDYYKNRYNTIHPYLRLDAGLTYSAFNLGPGEDLTGFQYIGNLAVGAEYKRSRIELAYQPRATISDVIFSLVNTYAAIDSDAYMINYYYDFFSTDFFDAYIGTGAGIDKWQYEYRRVSASQTTVDNGVSFIGGLYLGVSFNIPMHYVIASIDTGIDYYYQHHFRMHNITPKVGLRLTL